jgi:tetratricopeptide (TPR) repeat protein
MIEDLAAIYTYPMPADATTAAAPTEQADVCLDIALDRMAAGDPASAIPHLQSALALDPQHPAAIHALLRAFEDTGRLDEAFAVTHQRIADAPDDALAHTRLSILYQRAGDVPAAEAAAARAKILGWKHQLLHPEAPSL